MKPLIAVFIILIISLSFCIFNTNHLYGIINHVIHHIKSGNFTEAYSYWQEKSQYLHLVISNDKVDEIATSIKLLSIDPNNNKKSSAAVIATLEQLLDNERVSLQNIFICL